MKEETKSEELLEEARMMRHASWGGQLEEMRSLIHQLASRLESAREALKGAYMFIQIASRTHGADSPALREKIRQEIER